jgi:class 3 adenylate cyclase
MLSISALHFVAFLTFMVIAGRFDKLPQAVFSNVAILVVVNLICAAWLFRPIARYLETGESFARANQRIHRLAAMSTLLGVGLVMIMTFVGLFIVRGMCPGCELNTQILFNISLMAVFAIFVGIFLYFLIDDFTAQLREHIFRRFRQVVPPKGVGLGVKVVAAFVGVSVVPTALAFLEVFVFPPARQAQGITQAQAFLFDLVIILFVTFTSFFFIQRNLRRPVRALVETMGLVAGGDFSQRAPVITDGEIGELAVDFNAMVQELEDRAFIRETFGKYVPEAIAAQLVANKGVIAPAQRLATILYTDIQGFTSIAESISPTDVVSLLNEYFSLMVEVIDRYKGTVNQFQGDALLVTYNVPIEDANHAADAVRSALEIQARLSHHRFSGDIELVTRIGVNSGMVVAGSVGAHERLNYTVHGDAVNLAARLETLNKEYGTRILVSEATRALAGDGFTFAPMGEIAIRGKTESVSVYNVGA